MSFTEIDNNNKISFYNDEFLAHKDCKIHISDRIVQFADGVYEVILLENNRLIDMDYHLERLFQSMDKLNFNYDLHKININFFKKNIINLIKLNNNLQNCSIYIQISRGSSVRNQYIDKNLSINILIELLNIKRNKKLTGIKAITYDDIRWKKCNIKSVAILANILLKDIAKESGAEEAILIRDNFITEASFANIFIVKDNFLITRELSELILGGITRKRIINLSKINNIKIIEKKFTKEELYDADEIFVTSSTLKIRPIIAVDNKIINKSNIGFITRRLIDLYDDFILDQYSINDSR